MDLPVPLGPQRKAAPDPLSGFLGISIFKILLNSVALLTSMIIRIINVYVNDYLDNTHLRLLNFKEEKSYHSLLDVPLHD